MFQINIEKYQGPFDLILELISKKKLEICEIKIIDIIIEYLEYIKKANLDVDIQGDFLLVASRLLELKSRYLLLVDNEDEDDDMDKLVRSLELYKKHKELAQLLKLREEYYGELYSRKPNEQFISEIIDVDKLTLNSIEESIPLLLRKIDKEAAAIRSKKIVSVEDKINEIEEMLKAKKIIYFTEIAKCDKKDDSIAAMLSILEMAKVEKVGIIQYDLFNDIIIEGK